MSDTAASADMGGMPLDAPPAQPTPPTMVIGAGSSHNSGIALEWQPDIAATVAAAQAAIGQVTGIVAQQQAEAGRFFQESGAEVLGGHAPVAMNSANPAGDADFGSPVQSGQDDG